jgi:hypothetical protein
MKQTHVGLDDLGVLLKLRVFVMELKAHTWPRRAETQGG